MPAGYAAAWRGVPFALLNADASAQLSMRILRPIAASVMCGFDGSARQRLLQGQLWEGYARCRLGPP